MLALHKFLNGLGGTVHGSLFRVADHIDTEKPPGRTSLVEGPDETPFLRRLLTGAEFVYSPNLTWLALACIMLLVFPYNLQSSWKESLIERLLINHVIILSYVGFWHITLYGLGWGKRPLVANRPYEWSKVLHNAWYTTLGVIQWSFTEAAFLHCYRTGKLQLSSLDTPQNMFHFFLWCLAVPVIRDIHFYLAHRLIHAQFLYTFIHGVHHRNTDIEPFSGLCMHPCEHLYYYTCYAPLLLLSHHPFILLWMGMHTVISPAASHSGYEDHFSADLYHYCHHRYFECNYAGGIPFDKWFGTFRDKLGDSDVIPRDVKATLVGWPEYPLFQILGVGLPIALLIFHEDIPLDSNSLALFVAFLPVLNAALLYRGNRPMLSPFDKDSLTSQVFHLGGGVLLGVLPVYYLIAQVLT